MADQDGTRREALLRAATHVFLRDGYTGAAVREITELAGCGTGTFYLHFPSKDDCFLALIDRLYHQVLKAVVEARALQGGVAEKLWVSIETVIRMFAQERELAAVVLLQGPGAAPVFRERLERVRLTLADLIAEDLVETGMDLWTAQCGARTLTGALGEVLVWQVAQKRSSEDLLAAGEAVRRLFWKGCGLPPVTTSRGL